MADLEERKQKIRNAQDVPKVKIVTTIICNDLFASCSSRCVCSKEGGGC